MLKEALLNFAIGATFLIVLFGIALIIEGVIVWLDK